MKKINKFIVILWLVLGSSAQSSTLTKTISDSLVENLSCGKLQADEILRRILPESLTAQYHNLSVNWPFSAGLYDLAACWSLSRSQRLFFYLARWNEGVDANSQQTTEIMDMVRGSRPYAGSGDRSLRELPLPGFSVFPIRDSQWRATTPLWARLQYGYSQKLGNGKSLYRAWRNEIEHYQKARFHEFSKNLKLIIGNDARSAKKNRETRAQLLRNLESHRLTLLVLRPTRMSQHVVVAKSFKINSNGSIDITVYDSNQPLRDQTVTFRAQDSQFYAPQIVRGLPRVKNAQDPVGVFIVDEYDRSVVENSLVRYYKKKCQE